MVNINDIINCMREMAPEDLAEPWDNCGLLVASESRGTGAVIACLDVTKDAVEAAVRSDARLIVCHHPLMLNPIKRIDTRSRQSVLLRAVIKNDVAVYAAHTNVDKTYGGLNDLLAGLIGVTTDPPGEGAEQLGYYRAGMLPEELSVAEFNAHVSSRLKLKELTVSSRTRSALSPIGRVVVMSGSYSLEARQMGALRADALVCGEIRHHELLELNAMGIHVVQAGHHGSERFFINLVQRWINDKYPELPIKGVGFADHPTEVYIGEYANGDV